MDNKAKELMYATGVDEKLAEMLVKFTGGDVDGAKKIIQSMPKDYMALKIRYMGHKTHRYGAILLVLNMRQNSIEDIYAIVDNKLAASQLDALLPFEDFKLAIINYLKGKDVNLEMMGRLREAINTTEIKDQIFSKLLKDNKFDLEQLKVVFSELIFKILTESNSAVKIEQEEVDLFRIHRNVEKKPEGVVSEDELPDTKSDGSSDPDKDIKEEVHIRNISLVLLKTEPVLSPIKGTPLTEFQEGDEIMVKIIDEREIGDYLANLLGGKKDNSIIPIPATIKEIKHQEDTDNLMVLVQFGPGIAGKMYVPAEIKVETPYTEELSKMDDALNFKINPVWIFIFLAVLLFIFIYLTIYFGR